MTSVSELHFAACSCNRVDVLPAKCVLEIKNKQKSKELKIVFIGKSKKLHRRNHIHINKCYLFRKWALNVKTVFYYNRRNMHVIIHVRLNYLKPSMINYIFHFNPQDRISMKHALNEILCDRGDIIRYIENTWFHLLSISWSIPFLVVFVCRHHQMEVFLLLMHTESHHNSKYQLLDHHMTTPFRIYISKFIPESLPDLRSEGIHS